MLQQSRDRHVPEEITVFQYAHKAAALLREVADATAVPSMKAVGGISLLILDAIQVRHAKLQEFTG